MQATVAATPTGLSVRGRVDFLNADQLCAEGSRLLKEHVEPISIDLEQLDHAGSLVIAILIVWAGTSQQALHLVALPKSMRRVLEFTGMDELFVLPELTGADALAAAPANSDSARAAGDGSVAGGLLHDAATRSIEDVGKESNP